MTKTYDALIIGAGHNGLVAAAYLAKAKKSVLVLEKRSLVGGTVVTEEFADGIKADSVWAGGTLRPDIVKHLRLAQFGFPPFASAHLCLPSRTGVPPVFAARTVRHWRRQGRPASTKPAFISLLPDSDKLVLDADPAKAAESIRRFSERDAQKWPAFLAFMDKAARFLDSAYATIMPRLPKFGLEEGYALAELALDLRLTGRKDMLNLLRALPMTAQEFLEEWFESEALKAAIASVGIHGVTLGVMSAGTAFNLIHNWLNRGGLSHINVGGAGQITQALANAVKAYGGEIRTEAEVRQVVVKDMRAAGVILSKGEEISAPTVLSAVDPKRTFLSLVGPMELPPMFVWNVQSIKMRGSAAKVHLAVESGHGVPEGTTVIAPSLKYLERAYDAAKYGETSEKPYLEVTASENVVSIHMQFVPYALKSSDWNAKRKTLEDLAINTLAEYFPNLKSSIINLKSLTPKDLEDTYALTEGDLNHGQIMLDQFFFMRPIPGWSDHKTPIAGLYLCGSGVHAGGGVSGASGRNAARIVLKDK